MRLAAPLIAFALLASGSSHRRFPTADKSSKTCRLTSTNTGEF